MPKYFDYTIYAKRQPRPLVGDEIYPNGSVGITFKPTPNITFEELAELITSLQVVLAAMGAASLAPREDK